MDVRNGRFAVVLCVLVIGCVASGFAGAGALAGLGWLCVASLTLVTIGVTSHATTLVHHVWSYRLLTAGLLATAVVGAVASARFYVATASGTHVGALVLGLAFVLVALFVWRALVAPTARRIAQAGGLAVVLLPFAAIGELILHIRQHGFLRFFEGEPALARSKDAGAVVLVAMVVAFVLGALGCAAAHAWFGPGRGIARARVVR